MKDNKKKVLMVALGLILVVVTIGFTYAYVSKTLAGTKKVILTAGTLSLVLAEENEITISDALPMYDAVGMIQEKVFNFSLNNNTSNPTEYTVKLQKVSTSNELSTSDVKYYLTKDGVGTPAFLSSLTDGVVDTGTIAGNQTIEYTLRLWISDAVTQNTAISGKSLSYKLVVEASMEDSAPSSTVTFAGITKNVNETTSTMFNYSSQGVDSSGASSASSTNGIYAMEDNDSTSYFYRGNVNNLVKFGTYTKDYAVYRFTDLMGTLDFASLEACKFYDESCSEANKVIKYKASDNVPMYWRIVRINGDGTIRMVYAGTSPNAGGQELGIGLSRYNEERDNPKYAGYTYDKSSVEVASDAKNEIDTWYTNVLEGTTYDSKIVTGKFCSDSSAYGEITYNNSTMNAFGPLKRAWSNQIGLGNVNPTFKCSTATDANFGGSYNLKAGLMTLDEVVAAGALHSENTSNYLYDTRGFWTMSPASFVDGFATVGFSALGTTNYSIVNLDFASLRPVINLRADILFKSGTDGSTTSPYEIS